MLLIHTDISHMPITELENNSEESVWVKVFRTTLLISWQVWYRPPDDTLEKLKKFDLLFRDHFIKSGRNIKATTPLSPCSRGL